MSTSKKRVTKPFINGVVWSGGWSAGKYQWANSLKGAGPKGLGTVRFADGSEVEIQEAVCEYGFFRKYLLADGSRLEERHVVWDDMSQTTIWWYPAGGDVPASWDEEDHFEGEYPGVVRWNRPFDKEGRSNNG